MSNIKTRRLYNPSITTEGQKAQIRAAISQIKKMGVEVRQGAEYTVTLPESGVLTREYIIERLTSVPGTMYTPDLGTKKHPIDKGDQDQQLRISASLVRQYNTVLKRRNKQIQEDYKKGEYLTETNPKTGEEEIIKAPEYKLETLIPRGPRLQALLKQHGSAKAASLAVEAAIRKQMDVVEAQESPRAYAERLHFNAINNLTKEGVGIDAAVDSKALSKLMRERVSKMSRQELRNFNDKFAEELDNMYKYQSPWTTGKVEEILTYLGINPDDSEIKLDYTTKVYDRETKTTRDVTTMISVRDYINKTNTNLSLTDIGRRNPKK